MEQWPSGQGAGFLTGVPSSKPLHGSNVIISKTLRR